MRCTALGAVALCAVTYVSIGAASHTEVSSIVHGRQLYIADGCPQCHGYIGQGSAGPRLAPDPLPLEVFTRQLRNPMAVMPIYTRAILSDADLADIYAYLKSIPRPKPVTEIPLLK
jgi:ubiquinol-cytochrome c reductase cytochrome c subunit